MKCITAHATTLKGQQIKVARPHKVQQKIIHKQ